MSKSSNAPKTMAQFARMCAGRYGAGKWQKHPTEAGVSVRYISPGEWRAISEREEEGHVVLRAGNGPTMALALEDLANEIKGTQP